MIDYYNINKRYDSIVTNIMSITNLDSWTQDNCKKFIEKLCNIMDIFSDVELILSSDVIDTFNKEESREVFLETTFITHMIKDEIPQYYYNALILYVCDEENTYQVLASEFGEEKLTLMLNSISSILKLRYAIIINDLMNNRVYTFHCQNMKNKLQIEAPLDLYDLFEQVSLQEPFEYYLERMEYVFDIKGKRLDSEIDKKRIDITLKYFNKINMYISNNISDKDNISLPYTERFFNVHKEFLNVLTNKYSSIIFKIKGPKD